MANRGESRSHKFSTEDNRRQRPPSWSQWERKARSIDAKKRAKDFWKKEKKPLPRLKIIARFSPAPPEKAPTQKFMLIFPHFGGNQRSIDQTRCKLCLSRKWNAKRFLFSSFYSAKQRAEFKNLFEKSAVAPASWSHHSWQNRFFSARDTVRNVN